MTEPTVLQVVLENDIPILAEADTVVVGGTLAACVAACERAARGQSVVLATGGCSVPEEFVVCRRPWIRPGDLAALPEPFRRAFAGAIEQPLEDGSSLLSLTRLSIAVEDLLLDASVCLYYGMVTCGVVTTAAGQVSSVIFGGKFGLQAIAAAEVVDVTSTAIVPRLAGCAHELSREPTVAVRLTAKVAVKDGSEAIDVPEKKQAVPTTWPDGCSIDVPGVPALVDGRVILHGPYAEFVLRLPVGAGEAIDVPRLSVAARMHLAEIGEKIGIARRAEGKPPLYFHRYSGALLVDSVVRLHERPTNVDVVQDAEPVSSNLSAEVRLGGERPGGNSAVMRWLCGDPSRIERGRMLSVTGARRLPVHTHCDVIVAGGGTSGVPAALAAAREGARVVLIEQHADVGGTQTVGGVGNYWFGRETPFQLACDRAYETCSTRTGMTREIGMMQSLVEAGVTVLAPAVLIGVVCDGERAAGVTIATEQGIAFVAGEIVIDATGDADIAAWAGVPYEFGNDRDAWTIWGSFANFNAEKRTASRQYESSTDVTDAGDFRRGIAMGRRRQGMWRRQKHDMPQLYFAPRETRRIEAGAMVTYGGILAGETFPDVIAVCESNFDIKGIASSDLLNSGVVWSWETCTCYLAAIPFRAILPESIANLLVVGRSYCAAHDAQSLARMQRDMISLGGGAGIAATRAVQTQTSLRELDVAQLQEEWVRRGTLRAEDRDRFGRAPSAYSAADARRDADALLEGDVSPLRLARLASSPVGAEPLRAAFSRVENLEAKRQIARLLCLLGDTSGVDYLVSEIGDQIGDGLPQPQALPLREPPEHGWAPEPVYSLYAIGLAGAGEAAIDVMLQVARALDDDAEQFASRESSPFEYIRAICAVADRNPGAEMIPVLEELLAKCCLRDMAISREADPRSTIDPMLERRAYCELCLGRGLARCGDRRGYDILISYIDDIRAPLARSAIAELTDLLGSVAGAGVEDWRRRAAEVGCAPRPYTRRL